MIRTVISLIHMIQKNVPVHKNVINVIHTHTHIFPDSMQAIATGAENVECFL